MEIMTGKQKSAESWQSGSMINSDRPARSLTYLATLVLILWQSDEINDKLYAIFLVMIFTFITLATAYTLGETIFLLLSV